MTDQHPLTDEILEDRFHIRFVKQYETERVFDQDEMRSAADWQLEQVIEFLESYEDPIWYNRLTDEFQLLVDDIQKAMRPQQQVNKND